MEVGNFLASSIYLPNKVAKYDFSFILELTNDISVRFQNLLMRLINSFRVINPVQSPSVLLQIIGEF